MPDEPDVPPSPEITEEQIIEEQTPTRDHAAEIDALRAEIIQLRADLEGCRTHEHSGYSASDHSHESPTPPEPERPPDARPTPTHFWARPLGG